MQGWFHGDKLYDEKVEQAIQNYSQKKKAEEVVPEEKVVETVAEEDVEMKEDIVKEDNLKEA